MSYEKKELFPRLLEIYICVSTVCKNINPFPSSSNKENLRQSE